MADTFGPSPVMTITCSEPLLDADVVGIPGGIDYQALRALALPASREGFADALDFVELD
jgi:hypothetical protein